MSKKVKLTLLLSLVAIILVLTVVFLALLVPRPLSKDIPTKNIVSVAYIDSETSTRELPSLEKE